MQQDIVSKAQQLVSVDRRKEYGSVDSSFTRIACMWSGVLGIQITTEQVALCMICFKIARESNLHKEDNLVDIIGYTICLEELINLEKESNPQSIAPDWINDALNRKEESNAENEAIL